MQGAGDACKKTAQGKGVDFGESGMHPHCISGPVIVTNCDKASAVTGTQEVPYGESGKYDNYENDNSTKKDNDLYERLYR